MGGLIPRVKRTVVVYEMDDGSYDAVNMEHPPHLGAMEKIDAVSVIEATVFVIEHLTPQVFAHIEQAQSGARYVWVCDRCGQPLPRHGECRSGIHMGPADIGTDNNVGRPIRSTDLAARLEFDRKVGAALAKH